MCQGHFPQLSCAQWIFSSFPLIPVLVSHGGCKHTAAAIQLRSDTGWWSCTAPASELSAAPWKGKIACRQLICGCHCQKCILWPDSEPEKCYEVLNGGSGHENSEGSTGLLLSFYLARCCHVIRDFQATEYISHSEQCTLEHEVCALFHFSPHRVLQAK